MAYGIVFEKKGDIIEGRFGGEWPEKCEFNLSLAAIKKLGKLICALANGRKKHFKVRLEEKENALTAFGKTNWYRGSTLIRFEFVSMHPHFRVPCHNRFNYDGFTKDELLRFGKALEAFDSAGIAIIGDATIAGFARSFEEELLM